MTNGTSDVQERSRHQSTRCRGGLSSGAVVAALMIVIAPSARADSIVPAMALARIESASDSMELDAALYQVVAIAPSHELKGLKAHEHTGVALQAAWDEVARLVGPAHPKRKNPRLDRAAIQRFIGFVEGRLRVEPPEWWEESLLRARANLFDNRHVLLSMPDPEKKGAGFYQPVDDEEVLWAQAGLSIEEVNSDHIIVKEVGDEKLRVPTVVNDQAIWGFNAQIIDNKRYLAAVHGAVAGGYIVCIDRSSQKHLWIAKVWGEYSRFWRQGAGFYQWIECRVRNDIVYVFGITTDVAFIEAFSLRDGANLFRFSTSYCSRRARNAPAQLP